MKKTAIKRPARPLPRGQALLLDPNVRRWHDSLKRGSHATARVYLRRLDYLLEKLCLTPQSLLELSVRERDDVLHDYVGAASDAGLSGGSLKVIRNAVVSWLDWNGQKLGRKLKAPGGQERPRASTFQIPDPAGLRRTVDAGDARSRFCTTAIAHAGFRPEVLGNVLGTDGLRFRDLPEATLTPTGVEFKRIPTLVKVPAHLNKIRKAFFTFLGQEACDYLTAYASERVAAGEKLTPDSPIVANVTRGKPFVASETISEIVRQPMRSANLQEPPYIWRSYFRSCCMNAQSKGLLWDWSEFFMGHKGLISATYALHKVLPPETVEKMRAAYAHALKFLESRQAGPYADPYFEVAKVILQTYGYTAEDVEAQIADKEPQEVVKLIRKAQDDATAAKAPKQRLIRSEELPQAMKEGWTVRLQLTDGQIVVEA